MCTPSPAICRSRVVSACPPSSGSRTHYNPATNLAHFFPIVDLWGKGECVDTIDPFHAPDLVVGCRYLRPAARFPSEFIPDLI